MGKGLRDAPRDAIVSESLDESKRGKGFGIQRAMDSLGAILGSVFVLILFWYLDFSIRAIFLIAAFLALTAVIPIFFVKEPKKLKERSGENSSRKKFFTSFKNLPPELKKFIFIAVIFYFANFNFMFFILKASGAFGILSEKLAITLPILLYIFFNIFDAALSEPAGYLSDKIGRKPVLILGYSFFTISSIGFTMANSFAYFLVLFALYGAFKAFIDASQKAFVSDLSDTGNRGTALGAFETSTGLALIPAGIIAGLLWNINTTYPFFYGSALSLISILLFITLIKNHKIGKISG